jgi:hypothetical protein
MNNNNMNNNNILEKSYKKAINGGLSGFIAMSFQVTSLMWLRTIVNNQYNTGFTFKNTFNNLMKDGGFIRFYRGYPYAMMLAPLSRFGDTAMNIGVMTMLKDKDLSLVTKTFLGSCGASLWRISIMPFDTCKTSMQVNGSDGMKLIKNKIRINGYGTLYHGSLAAASSTMVGHFPWFFTYNYLNTNIPKPNNDLKNIGRSAFIGFMSSSLSDICSNSFRVIKTNRQINKDNIGYIKLTKKIIEKDSLLGLFTRGLKTKIITNGIQGMSFTIMFDYLKNKNN